MNDKTYCEEHGVNLVQSGGICALCLRGVEAPSSNEQVSWRCFHCAEVFTDREAAADHFGVQIDGCADDVACKLNATDGLLLKMLREAQQELRQYHQEDNAAFRQFYVLGADHATALRREEEKGYARGLEDARKHPESIGLRPAVETKAPPRPASFGDCDECIGGCEKCMPSVKTGEKP